MSNQNVSTQGKDGRERLAISVEETARSLSVSQSFVRSEIARGRLRPVRLGRRVLISEAEVRRYLAASRSKDDQASRLGGFVPEDEKD